MVVSEKEVFMILNDFIKEVNSIKRKRKGMGLSLRELANKAGISHQTVNNIENDPFSCTLSNIVKVIEVVYEDTRMEISL